MYFKDSAGGFKDIDAKQGIITGYFSSFGNKDSDGDIIEKGAYAKTIMENGPDSTKPRIKNLKNHNPNIAPAKLLALKEDDKGLYYEAKAGRHTEGQDYLKMIEDGIITEHSVGFYPVKQDQRSDGNHITEIKLLEGSGLTFLGANENTPIVGVKAFKLPAIMEKMAILVKTLRSGTYSDATFVQIEKEFNYLKSLIDGKPDLENDTTSFDDNKPSMWGGFINVLSN